MGLDYAFRRRGPLTMAPSQLGIFTRSDPHRERANIQFHVQPLSLDKFGDPLHRFPAITVSACNLQPTSRGTVRIRSALPDQAPSIAPNYLSTGEDRQVAADAIRTTRRLMKQPALAPYRPEEFLPGPSVGDDDASLAKAAGDIGTTIFHPVGTAKMGTASDPMAVVDARLRFYGIAGLRVADASVMPTITSGNTNTPTAMIAEKAATMILEDSAERERMDAADTGDRLEATQADLRTALSTSVLPSDQIAPGTLWLDAITWSNAVSIQLQSSSVMVSGGNSLMVWLPWPETWVRIL